MLNTRHQTWGAKRFNIVELTNVVQLPFDERLTLETSALESLWWQIYLINSVVKRNIL